MTTCNELQHFLAPLRWASQHQHETDVDGNSHRLLNVLSLNTGIDAATWGITIVRTDYRAPREHLLNALACINHAVQADLGATRSYAQRRSGIVIDGLADKENWPPLHGKQKQKVVQLADELFARYTIELLSKYDGLNEADTDTIRRSFQSWIMQVQGNPHGGDMRYVFCIILDTDAIQQLHDVWSGGARRSRVAPG